VAAPLGVTVATKSSTAPGTTGFMGFSFLVTVTV
jgi:hypothetical protein